MKTLLTLSFACAIMMWVAGCHDEHDHAKTGASTVAADSEKGHDHAHGHSHEPEIKETLGLQTVGPYEVVAVQMRKWL